MRVPVSTDFSKRSPVEAGPPSSHPQSQANTLLIAPPQHVS